jgi:acetyl esterase/lipase
VAAVGEAMNHPPSRHRSHASLRMTGKAFPRRAGVLALLCLMASARLRAEAADASLTADIHRDFDLHDYSGAAQACRRILARHPADAAAAYDLACALARLGQRADSDAALALAFRNGFNDADYACGDADLAALHGDPSFAALIAAMRARAARAGVPCEPAQQVPTSRLVEKDPGGSMRYRLYLPDTASPANQARLMVWLHPSGASDDAKVLTLLVPDLVAHGWAVMIFPQKPNYRDWTLEQYQQVGACIHDALAEPAVDRHRPVPLTFSAGGYMALELWHEDPAYWSALVIDCACNRNLISGQPRPLTTAQIASAAPVLAIEGERDPNRPVWEHDAPTWTAAGVPTQLVIVAGHGHEFLYSGDAWTMTLAWLDRLKASQAAAPGPSTRSGGAAAPRGPGSVDGQRDPASSR